VYPPWADFAPPIPRPFGQRGLASSAFDPWRTSVFGGSFAEEEMEDARNIMASYITVTRLSLSLSLSLCEMIASVKLHGGTYRGQ